jgi:hypothetical protein
MTVSWVLYKLELATPVPPEDRQHRTTDRLAMTGYWRLEAAKTKPDYPVIILNFEDQSPTKVQIGERMFDSTDEKAWQDFIEGTWPWCRAVKREAVIAARDTGFWPDDNKPARKMTQAEKLGIDTSVGGNNPPADESLKDQIEALRSTIAAHTVTDQASANKARELLDKMKVLQDLADAEFEKEKKPIREDGNRVDAKWHEIRDPGTEAAKKLATELRNWLEAQRKKAEAAAAEETEKQRKKAAEEALKQAAQTGQTMTEDEAAKIAEQTVAPVQAPTVQASSPHGRAMKAKAKTVAKVTDYNALAAYFCIGTGSPEEPKPDLDFAQYLDKRATKAKNGGVQLPGVEFVEA